jgi:hypothetical protein
MLPSLIGSIGWAKWGMSAFQPQQLRGDAEQQHALLDTEFGGGVMQFSHFPNDTTLVSTLRCTHAKRFAPSIDVHVGLLSICWTRKVSLHVNN